MDILTPRGQLTLEQERLALGIFKERFSDYDIVETPKDRPADIDGFIVHGTNLLAGIEVKCRNMTAHELKNQFGNRWLVTADKLDRGVNICRGLCIPFKGFLYLVPDNMLIIKTIWTPKDGYDTGIDYMQSETQATVNGGTAFRINAYIDVSGSTVIAEI